MKKSHIVFSVLFFFFLIALNFAPKIIKASQDDWQSFSLGEKDIFRITKEGGIRVASGIKSIGHSFLFAGQVTYIDLKTSSDSRIINPQFFITTTSILNSATTYTDDFANMVQPDPPRTLQFLFNYASGTVIVKGTDSFNRSVTENIDVSSGLLTKGTIPFLYISSFTIKITSVSVDQSSSTFYVGVGTGIALPWDIDFSSDVYAIYEDNVSRPQFVTGTSSAVSVNAVTDTISISSNTLNGTKDYQIWALIRKTLFIP